MIATMAVNLPKETDAVKTTLVVVPAALLQQASLFSLVDFTHVDVIASGKRKLRRSRMTCLPFIYITDGTSFLP
jgi:hypothetical protein